MFKYLYTLKHGVYLLVCPHFTAGFVKAPLHLILHAIYMYRVCYITQPIAIQPYTVTALLPTNLRCTSIPHRCDGTVTLSNRYDFILSTVTGVHPSTVTRVYLGNLKCHSNIFSY